LAPIDFYLKSTLASLTYDNNKTSMLPPNARPPLPAALVCRGTRRLLCRARPQRTGARVCFENDPGRRSAAKLLDRDGAERIAVNIAKLPELLATRGLR